MLSVCEDIILKISKLLTDKEKISFSATIISINRLKHKFIFQEKTNMGQIKYLPYFDNFEFVEISDIMYTANFITHFPKNMKYVHFRTCNTCIPPFVTHLTFGDHFNQTIKDCLPRSITYLTFGYCFNQSMISITSTGDIIQHIPNSVSRLKFSRCFDQLSKDAIPKSVTHLTFSECHHNSVFELIPESVTHLEFGYHYGKLLNVPSSIIQISLPRYNKCINYHPTTKIIFR